MSDIVVGSVAVDIVPDTRNFRRDLQAKVQGIDVSVDVSANTDRLRAQLDEATRPREATITANADVVAAEAKLDEVARDRTAKVNARVDNKGLVGAAAGLSSLTSAALTLGPALIPLAATIGAISVGLAAPLAIAGGGLTVFGFLTGFAVKKTEEQKKQIEQLGKAVDAAKQQLANTQASAATSAANSLATAQASAAASLKSARTALANAKTAAQRKAAQARIDAAEQALQDRRAAIQRSQSASVAAAQRKVTDAVKAYNTALAGLTPAQKRMLDAQDKLKGAFDKLITTAGPAILGPVTKALNILSGLLPALTPLITAASDAVGDLLDSIGNATKGKGFRDFVKAFSDDLGPDIKAFGRIFGNVFIGLGGILLAFNDTLGGPLLKNLGDLTGKFADFGKHADKSKGLQDFIGYVKDVGPQVGSTLGAIGGALGHIVKALAPLGLPALKVVEGIADAFASIPIPVLTALAGATAGLVAVSKLTKLGGSIGGLLKGGFFGDRGSRTNPMYVVTLNGGAGPGGSTKFFGFNPATVVLAATVAAGIFSKHFADNERDRNIKQFGTNDVVQIAMVKLQRERDAEFLREFGKKKIRIDDSPAALERLSAAQKIEAGGFQIPTDQAGPLVRGGKLDPAALFIKFGLTPERARQLINSPQISASTGNVDALNASLATASRRIDLVGPKARASFGEASRVIGDTKTKLDAIKDKKLRILVDDLAAVRSLEALQAYRLKNKTLTVTLEQEIERAVGPGGGRGRPTGSASAGAIGATLQRSAPRSGSGSGASGRGSLVHIDNVSARDLDDILRQSDKASRARSGGGVILTGAPR